MASNGIERVSTGIPGFDQLIEGGLEKGSVTMLRGGTGSGKTIFSLQFLYEGCIRSKEPGIFISIAESQESLYTTGKRFGWDFTRHEKEGKFAFIKQSPHEVERILKEGGGSIKDTIDSVKAKRIVIDSLTAYSMMFKTTYEVNEGVLELMDMLKGWGCTTLVTDEEDIDVRRIESSRLGFLSDGLVHLYYVRKDHGKFRAVEIIKTRHTQHSDRMYLFKIGKSGVQVFPEMGIFSSTKETYRTGPEKEDG